MELRQYWRVLVRRRNVVRNTFLVALVLAILTTGYSIYNSFYLGSAVIDIQMQAERVSNSVVDPWVAAHQNTDQVVLAVSVYGTTRDYFKAVSTALQKEHIGIDWQTIGQSLDVHTGKSHIIYVNWSSSDANTARTVVAAAAQQLRNYVPVWRAEAQPNGPQIRTFVFDSPSTQRIHITKSLTDLGLKIALGFVAGIVLAYLFEYLDTTIQDESDVQHWLGLPTLAVIPGGSRSRRVRSA